MQKVIERMNTGSPILVGITCNIKTDDSSDIQAEFDEPETITAIDAALKFGGFDTTILEVTNDFPQKLVAAEPDIVFNIAEGVSGRSREAQIPAILDYYGIPYTGSDATTLALALDKTLTKQIVSLHNIQTPPSFLVKQGQKKLPCDLPLPVLIKPNAEGSSKGILDHCIAEDLTQLRHIVDTLTTIYHGDLLIEPYIDGREFTVGIIGNGMDTRIFEPMEIIYQNPDNPYKIYSYEVKRNFQNLISYQCPPRLPDSLTKKIMQDAKIVYQALGCLDFARIDFRLTPDGDVYFIEANPLPGLAPGYSDFPMLAEYNGMSYQKLVCCVLHCALRRFEKKAVDGIA